MRNIKSKPHNMGAEWDLVLKLRSLLIFTVVIIVMNADSTFGEVVFEDVQHGKQCSFKKY